MEHNLRHQVVTWHRLLCESGMGWMERYWLDEGHKAESELMTFRWPIVRDLKLRAYADRKASR